jgi:hypothetical protein
MTNNSNSQLYQDVFALNTAINKTYIEIGAAGPIKINNTYLLEQHRFKGFSIEWKDTRAEQWAQEPIRSNKIYCADAITFDYLNGVKENNLPNHIGYLSCDIEPPANTFAALQRVIEQGITFDCITFEHDKYQSDVDFDPIVTEYLLSKGYKVAVKDVYRLRKFRPEGSKKKIYRKCFMETWFVHNAIEFDEQSYDEWKSNQNLL